MKKDRGITIITLIITIVIMLILLSIGANITINSAIFDKTENVVNKTNNQVIEQQQAVNEFGNIIKELSPGGLKENIGSEDLLGVVEKYHFIFS